MASLSPDWISTVLGASWSAPLAAPFTSISNDTRELRACSESKCLIGGGEFASWQGQAPISSGLFEGGSGLEAHRPTEKRSQKANAPHPQGAAHYDPSKAYAAPIGHRDAGHALTPGALFVALRGPTRHGQEFLAQAAAAGATAALVEDLQPHPLPQLVVPDTLAALQKLAAAHRSLYKGTVIGLTGSSGKTSTKELLAHLLGPSTCKTEGNLNNHIGVPLTLLRADLSAPFWVIEAGIDKAGEMDPLAAMIAPDAALLTLIGSAHLEYFKHQDATAAEKSKLLSAVPARGFTVLHSREASRYAPLQNLPSRTLILTESTPAPLISNLQSLISCSLVPTPAGWNLTLGADTFSLPLWTPGMVQNAALCLTVAAQLGIPSATLRERLSSWRGAALRGEWLRFAGAPATSRLYLDAYNSNPEALADSLWRFERLSTPASPKLYLLGTMAELGDESDALHRQAMSLLPLQPQDEVWLVGAKAPVMAEALQALGHRATLCDDLEKIKQKLATFPGECFIKGSHSTNLHKLSSLCSPLSKT